MICLFVVSYSFAQQLDQSTEVTIKSLKIECESAEELKSVDWDDIREVIRMNDPEEVIALEFGLHEKKANTKIKGNFNFTIKGKTKDIENIITRAKKGVKALERMSTKINKINEN